MHTGLNLDGAKVFFTSMNSSVTRWNFFDKPSSGERGACKSSKVLLNFTSHFLKRAFNLHQL